MKLKDAGTLWGGQSDAAPRCTSDREAEEANQLSVHLLESPPCFTVCEPAVSEMLRRVLLYESRRVWMELSKGKNRKCSVTPAPETRTNTHVTRSHAC